MSGEVTIQAEFAKAVDDLIASLQVEEEYPNDDEVSYPVLGNVKASTLVALGMVKERKKEAPGPRAAIIGAKESIKIEVWADRVKRWFYHYGLCEWKFSEEWRYPMTQAARRDLCHGLNEWDARLVAAALEADSV